MLKTNCPASKFMTSQELKRAGRIAAQIFCSAAMRVIAGMNAAIALSERKKSVTSFGLRMSCAADGPRRYGVNVGAYFIFRPYYISFFANERHRSKDANYFVAPPRYPCPLRHP